MWRQRITASATAAPKNTFLYNYAETPEKAVSFSAFA
jgi:hypothetical protein